MSDRRAKIRAAVDAFVARVNAGQREKMSPDEVPERLRRGAADQHGDVDWQVIAAPDPERAPRLESVLPGEFPATFRIMISEYLYPPIDVGGITLLSNTDEERRGDLRTVLSPKESPLFALLTRFNMVQFARPDRGSYDPVCFDLGARRTHGEYPIVRLDHEELLQRERVRVVETIAPSFLDLIR